MAEKEIEKREKKKEKRDEFQSALSKQTVLSNFSISRKLVVLTSDFRKIKIKIISKKAI